jgi:CBS domain-containing protein
VTTAANKLLGVVCLADVRRLAAADWDRMQVGDVMTPLYRLRTLRPDQPAVEALRALNEQGVDQIPIVDGDELVGLVRRRELLKWLDLRGTEKQQGALSSSHPAARRRPA